MPVSSPSMSSIDLHRRFGGLERLYGAGALARLQAASVCVIGLGGVGSWAAEALARSGVGRLTLIDLDHIALSNLNRQAHALEHTLGAAKVQAMAARLVEINPALHIDTVEAFIDADNVASLVLETDLVLDAIDQVPAKAALLALCRRRGQFAVTTGGAGGRQDPTRIRVADLARVAHDPLAASLRARLRKEHDFPRGDAPAGQREFGVPCVYSDEPMQRPAELCAGEAGALSCAGYGSSMCVTAAFGCAAAAQVIAQILR